MEITILTREQIFGEERLNIFEKRGTIAPATDFSILIGGYISDCYHYNNNKLLEDRAERYWTSSNSNDGYNGVRVVFYSGGSLGYHVRMRDVGVRPTLIFSSIFNICSNIVRGRDGILEVEYGEYPQKVASKILQEELANAYKDNKNSIRKTGKTYTTDSRRWDESDETFSAQEHEEFEYNGKKYVRAKSIRYDPNILSNGERYQNVDYVWVEVSPIKWLVDVKNDIALSERVLFAGVQFDDKEEYDGNFKETFMYKYLNTIFIKDIQVQSKEIEISVIEEKSKRELDLEKLEKDKQKILSLRKSLGK